MVRTPNFARLYRESDRCTYQANTHSADIKRLLGGVKSKQSQSWKGNEAGLPTVQLHPRAADGGENLPPHNLPGWLHRESWHRLFYRYREDLAGFLLAWISVGLILVFARGLMRI